MFLDYLHFVAMLLLAGLFIRLVQMRLPENSDLKKALTFIY